MRAADDFALKVGLTNSPIGSASITLSARTGTEELYQLCGWLCALRLKNGAMKSTRTGASISGGELGDQGDYFIGLCLNVGRPSPQVNHIVQRVQRLFAARHGGSTGGHSSNFLEDHFYWRSGFYARAGKLVDSPFQGILPLEGEVQPLDVARVVFTLKR